MPDTITITLPMPSSILSGHAGGHWRPKAAATKGLRAAAKALALQAIGRGKAPRWKQASIMIAVYFADLRRRDLLNVVNAMKPAIDGLVDAGVIEDDCWTCLGVAQCWAMLDKANPRVEIQVEGQP